MKHASAEALRQLDPLLDRLRPFTALVESKPGIFYRGASAFLHFHEDPAGLFVDLKLDGTSFSRFKLSGASDNEALLARVSVSLSANRASAPRKASSL